MRTRSGLLCSHRLPSHLSGCGVHGRTCDFPRSVGSVPQRLLKALVSKAGAARRRVFGLCRWR